MTTTRSPLAASMAIHVGVAIALFSIVSVPIRRAAISRPQRTFTRIDLEAYRRALKGPQGGGSGARSPLPVSQGQAPKQSPLPFAPPMILATAKKPILLVEPALLTAPDLPSTGFPQWGDPLSHNTVLSSGPGSGGGIGPGKGVGFGDGNGPGSGPGPGGPGGGVSASHTSYIEPKVLYQVDPEFSEEARRAKYGGTVLLIVDVDSTGRAVNFRIAKSLGLGLDQKAIEAVSRWKFQPARRNGKPVTVPATIEVNFHLL